jgi:hypothetical protein
MRSIKHASVLSAAFIWNHFRSDKYFMSYVRYASRKSHRCSCKVCFIAVRL